MPNPSVNAYLAKHYLDGAKAEAILAREGENSNEGEKKRKRKKIKSNNEISSSSSGPGFKLVDDSENIKWNHDNEIDEDALIVKDETISKRQQSRWNKLGSGTKGEMEDQDDLPQIADIETGENIERKPIVSQAGPSNASNSIRAGLKTREEMRAERLERERKAAEEEEELKRSGKRSIPTTKEQEEALHQNEREKRQQETVYRDASGRKIDIAQEDEERRRKIEKERKLEKEKKDWNKGQIQIQREKEEKQREEEEKTTSFARDANDKKMNESFRNIQRQNDPAAMFLKNTGQSDEKQGKMPIYKGHFPPNRFGIRPGYRWDGVERSNGFENKLFQRRNERARRKAEHQAWSQEDM